MEEIWKDIYYTDSITGEVVDYRGLYQVSNIGRVKSCERVVQRIKKDKAFALRIHETILKNKTNGVYPTIALYKDNKDKYFLIHRIVASMFVENPCGYEIVNHKDCNPLNTRADNLEWCDTSYNVTYNNAAKRRGEKQQKPVFQYTLDGVFIRRWDSYSEAAEALDANRGNISNCVFGRCKSTKGFIWKSQ